MFIDDDEAQKKARTRSKVGLRVFKKKKTCLETILSRIIGLITRVQARCVLHRDKDGNYDRRFVAKDTAPSMTMYTSGDTCSN